MTTKARYFWPLACLVLFTDCTTKDLIVENGDLALAPHVVLDPYVRLTLVHNPGTAFGFDLHPFVGTWARPILILSMAAVLVVLLRQYSRAAPRTRVAAAALGLVCGGAAGNLLDRVRFPLGVVDFIDVGIGAHRFFTFNIADAAISVGAVVLALALWREEAQPPLSREV